MLNRDQILSATDIKIETVSVPEWGGDVSIRVISAADRERYENYLDTHAGKDSQNARAFYCVLCLCDEQGKRLFEVKDAEAIGQKSASVVRRIFEAAKMLNADTAEAVKELAKN